jgi:ribose 5-phosphate isomerase A
MNYKQQAARRAFEYVREGMVVGLGTGSTSAYFIDLVGEALRQGSLRSIYGVPTSEGAAEHARQLGIPLTGLEAHSQLDLVVDGADEVDPQLNLIKGLGRALLREKIVEIHTDHLVVIVDESKLVSRLGMRGPLPVEIVPFQAHAHLRWLNSLGCRAEIWLEENRSPVVTDNGNYLALCWFDAGQAGGGLTGIPDAYRLAEQLARRPGIVEHGLFLDMAWRVIVAGEQGITIKERSA